MEGAGLDAGGAEPMESPPHLTGRAGGEGDREHLGGCIDALGHAVGDPVGDRAGLAGARTGEDAHRAPQCLGDLALLGIEGAEEVGVGHGVEQLLGEDG